MLQIIHKFNHHFGYMTKLYISLLMIGVLLFIAFSLWPITQPNDQIIKQKPLEFKQKSTKFQGEIIVHLDLKGAPPKIPYYEKIFPIFAQLGVNGLLIEYEDMFPYYGTLKNIPAKNAYTLNEIHQINLLAHKYNLDIIPLIQTFGHMEYVLKLDAYKDLREVSSLPSVICPSHENTPAFIDEMIEQLIEYHPNSTRIHIGADEVEDLGVCNRCTTKMSQDNIGKNQLFLKHINAIVERLHARRPSMKILMWDDQFRLFSLPELRSEYVHAAIQPVVWKYTQNVYEFLGPSLWDMYKEIFDKVWIGSAFKGATESNRYYIDVTHYVENHRSWMSLYEDYRDEIDFQGIIITGWQRYDHFAVLCELLPIAIPSLAMCLRILDGHTDSLMSPPIEVAKMLQCLQPYGLIGSAFGTPKCKYPGGDLLEQILRLHQIQSEYDTIMSNSRTKGWMNDYNIKYTFTNPRHAEWVVDNVMKIRDELYTITNEMEKGMMDIYDNYTISEWKFTYIEPLRKLLDKIYDARNKLLYRTNWPRRPFDEL